MLSLQFIRENPDIVRAAIKNKSTKIDFDAFLVLDDKKKMLQQEVETLRAKRNELSASMGKGKPDPAVLELESKEDLQNLEKDYEILETEHSILLKQIPNIPTDDTPIGHTEEENMVVREWGKSRYNLLSHLVITPKSLLFMAG